MLYFETPYVKILWDEQNQFVHTKWDGFLELPEVQKGLRAALNLVKEKSAKIWLSDLTYMKIFTNETQEWILEEFYPKVTALGVKKIAFIKPLRAVAQLSLEQVLRSYDPTLIQTQFFDEADSAKKWLKEGLDT